MYFFIDTFMAVLLVPNEIKEIDNNVALKTKNKNEWEDVDAMQSIRL